MPAEYLAIKESLLKRGKPMRKAKRQAAATYNSRHHENPVGPNYESRQRRRQKAKRNFRGGTGKC